jgi:hypothetical protein
VLCLDAANPSSYPGTGTVWTDLSGNNNNGTLTNGPTFSSANKGSIVFDGGDDFISLDNTKMNSIFPSSSFSIELWIKTTNTTNYKGLFCIAYSLDMFYFANTFYVICNTSLGNINAGNSNLVINDGIWHQIGFTASSSGYSWFQDGLIRHTVSSNFWNGSLSPAGVFSAIGRAGNLGGNFPGSISLSRFYNKNLLAAEILQNYNATKGRFAL